MKKLSQQQWVKDLMLYLVLTMDKYNGDMKTEGYKYAINSAIDNYSAVIAVNKMGKECINVNIHPNFVSRFRKGHLKNILISQKAYDVLKKEDANDEYAKNQLHGEHLTPMSYTRGLLNRLLQNKDKYTENEIKQNIDYAFTDAKYCIITKTETKVLDGAKQVFTKTEIDQFIKEYETYFNKLSDIERQDLAALIGKSKRSCGFGSIRLFVLLNSGTSFVDCDGNSKSFKECIDILRDGNYTDL